MIINLIFVYKIFINIINISIALLRKQISGYPNFVNKFEDNFKNYVGVKYGVIYANGTTALEAILFSLNLNEKDEVLVPSFTFHSTISPIIYTKAKIKFLDIDYDNLNVSIKDLDSKINTNTKVVIIVHLYGMPVNMKSIMKLKSKYGFYLIEDCSHAHGAKFIDKSVGSFGDSSFFSFQGNKSVAAGEAGIALTKKRKTFEILQAYGHFGRYSGKYLDKNLAKIQFTGFGKKSRPHPLGIILAINDFKFLNFYNFYCDKNRKICMKIIEKFKYIRSTNKINHAVMGGFYRGFPIYPKKEFLSHITSKKFEQLANALISKKIKITYFKNISNFNEPLFRNINFLDFYFKNKKLFLTNNKYLENSTNLENKILFIDLRQSFSIFKVLTINKVISDFEKNILF